MSQVRWLLEQPDHVLNQNEVNSQFLHANRTMLHKNIVNDTVHGNVIRSEMTKGLDSYANAVVDEVKHSLLDNWGSGTKWKYVPVYSTMLDVIAWISNRALVGLPLCRDKVYLKHSRTFARNVVITASILNLLPRIVRPILGPLITAYDYYQYRQAAKFILRII